MHDIWKMGILSGFVLEFHTISFVTRVTLDHTLSGDSSIQPRAACVRTRFFAVRY